MAKLTEGEKQQLVDLIGKDRKIVMGKIKSNKGTTRVVSAMSSDLTFITNEPGKSLRDRFGVLLGDVARSLQDLSPLKSVGLHKLKGDRAGQWAMTVNDRWRICFRFKDGDAYVVEITDYHRG